MTTQITRTAARAAWPWWVLTALLALGVVVDVVDGAPLKLATSGLLLAASLLVASTRPPRSKAVMRLALALLIAAIAVVVYRLTGPGL